MCTWRFFLSVNVCVQDPNLDRIGSSSSICASCQLHKCNQHLHYVSPHSFCFQGALGRCTLSTTPLDMESKLVDENIDHTATNMYTLQTFMYIYYIYVRVCVCVCLCSIHRLVIERARTTYEADLIWGWYGNNHCISWKEAFKVQRRRATFMIHTWLNRATCKYVGKHIEHVYFGLHHATFCLVLVGDTISYDDTH